MNTGNDLLQYEWDTPDEGEDKYIIYNTLSKKAIKYKNITAYKKDEANYKYYKLWEKPIIFEYPIQAEQFINKHFKTNSEDYTIIQVE